MCVNPVGWVALVMVSDPSKKQIANSKSPDEMPEGYGQVNVVEPLVLPSAE